MAKKKTSTQIRSEAMKKSWAERRNSPMREQARKRKNDLKFMGPEERAKLKAKPIGEPKFWILWAPASYKPPKIRFGTLEKVREVADIMVNKYRQDIYVMESVELHRIGKPEVVLYNEKAPKEPKAKAVKPEIFQVLACPPPLSRQGQTWDQEQDNELARLWYGNIRSLHHLAERMGRSELSIEYRLDALGIRPRSD